jgi:putative component of membrane protein insertase Oxa1/YidC/SpoIIIJ protein YidD
MLLLNRPLKYLAVFCGLCFAFCAVKAQSPDLWAATRAGNEALQPRQYLYHHTSRLRPSLNPVKMGLRTAMFVYQKKITYQWSGSCLYTPSCSEFSRQCLEEFGLFKAGLLTIDRLSRCSPLMLPFLSPYDKVVQHVHYTDVPARYKLSGDAKNRD